jgi:uncharacterized protein (DUF58 family)
MPVTEAQAIRLTQQGDVLSSALPPLLVQAEKVAASVVLGIHGRKAAGPGESFWQYRPYAFGDSTQRIDWHRSARADGVFIRENEWESANTLWVWANTSERMNYTSHLASVTKRERAQLIATAMACLAVRGHERVGALGGLRHAGHGRVSLARVAEHVAAHRDDSIPQPRGMQRRAAAVLASDFLDDVSELKYALTAIASAGIRGHLVQIADPAEESLPFDGRIEFKGIDLPSTYLARKTEDLRADYVKAYAAHRNMLRELARSLGFSFTVHRTDQPAASVLLPLHLQVSGRAMAPQSEGAVR